MMMLAYLNNSILQSGGDFELQNFHVQNKLWLQLFGNVDVVEFH